MNHGIDHCSKEGTLTDELATITFNVEAQHTYVVDCNSWSTPSGGPTVGSLRFVLRSGSGIWAEGALPEVEKHAIFALTASSKDTCSYTISSPTWGQVVGCEITDLTVN